MSVPTYNRPLRRTSDVRTYRRRSSGHGHLCISVVTEEPIPVDTVVWRATVIGGDCLYVLSGWAGDDDSVLASCGDVEILRYKGSPYRRWVHSIEQILETTPGGGQFEILDVDSGASPLHQ